MLILQRDRLGQTRLYAPAPQMIYDEARPQERVFAEIANTGDDEAIGGRIEREIRFDPDLWILELEVSDEAFAELVPVTTP